MIGTNVTTTTCAQCDSPDAYFESKDLTFETLTFCRKCGYTEKYIVAEDVETTQFTQENIKELYDEGKYREALIYLGFTVDFIDTFDDSSMKEQLERMMKNPSRSPIFTYDKGQQYFKYKPVIKDGFGTYSYTDENHYKIRGRFINEKHREWKIKEIRKKLEEYMQFGKVEVYSCDKDEVVERII